jgi:hypothetical protein
VDEAVRESVRREFGELNRELKGMRSTLTNFIQAQEHAERVGVHDATALYKKTVEESAETVRKVTDTLTTLAARLSERFPPLAEGELPALNMTQLRLVMNQFSDLFDGYLHIHSNRDPHSALRLQQPALTPPTHGAPFYHMPYAPAVPERSHHRNLASSSTADLSMRPAASIMQTSSITSATPPPLTRVAEASEAQPEVPAPKEVTVTISADIAAALQNFLKDKSAQADKTGTNNIHDITTLSLIFTCIRTLISMLVVRARSQVSCFAHQRRDEF